MNLSVQSMVQRSIDGDRRVSPLEAVMGDHWAEIDLGNSMRLSLLGLMLKNQKKYGGQSAPGRSPLRQRVPLEVVRRAPQAMVKVIRRGGTSGPRGMRDQMSYLQKDGDAVLERSDRYFGTELDIDGREDLIEAWGLMGESATGSDKTTHFVVSFPRDTDHGAAYRAGRAWAEEMFALGHYGDVYDYYTAFHTDRAHPHIHVVVARRGLEQGDWLKVSRRSRFNYEEFRAVQVEVAVREGIVLEASPRLARGVSDRPVPDAEIRRAENEGREARAPPHTPLTAVRAAASMLLFAEQIEADARILEGTSPELADAMRAVAGALAQGRQVSADLTAKPIIGIEESRRQSEFIMERRNEILAGIELIDAELGSLPGDAARARLEREASRLKADAARFIPDVEELHGFSSANSQGFYKGLVATDPIEREIKDIADIEVGKIARTAGLDPETFVSRYNGNDDVPQRLSDDWRKDELENIQQNLQYRPGAAPAGKIEKLAQQAHDDVHRNALQTYRKAERDLETHADRKRQLHRIARLVREGKYSEEGVDDAFQRAVKDTLHTSQLRQLEAGKPEAFDHITKNIDEQRALSRRYLETESQVAVGSRRLQLETALAKINFQTSRDSKLASREQEERTRSARTPDRPQKHQPDLDR